MRGAVPVVYSRPRIPESRCAISEPPLPRPRWGIQARPPWPSCALGLRPAGSRPRSAWLTHDRDCVSLAQDGGVEGTSMEGESMRRKISAAAVGAAALAAAVALAAPVAAAPGGGGGGGCPSGGDWTLGSITGRNPGARQRQFQRQQRRRHGLPQGQPRSEWQARLRVVDVEGQHEQGDPDLGRRLASLPQCRGARSSGPTILFHVADGDEARYGRIRWMSPNSCQR